MANKNFVFEKATTNSSVGCAKTNSHPTNPHSIINCCFDWFKFVFPFETGINNKIVTSYSDVYNDYRKNLPELTNEEIFKIIEKDYPFLKPGIKYTNKGNEVSENSDTGVWSLQKIKTCLEHWFNLDSLIPESSNESLGFSKGFKYMITYTPGIHFCYDGAEMNHLCKDGVERQFKTCCIELKGSGCRKVEELGVELIKVLEFLYKIPGCHATRIDFATDLINDNDITFDWLKEMLFDKVSFLTSFKKVVVYEPKEIKTDDSGLKYFDSIGTTIKFGSEASTSKLNIYDKKAERFENEDLDVSANSWIRFEIQVFKEKAEKVIQTLMAEFELKQFNKFCKSLLFNHLDIKTNKNIKCNRDFRSNRINTWPTHPFWESFIGNVGKTKIISQEKLESDFTRTRNWYNRNVIGTQTFLDIFYKENPITRLQTLDNQIEFLENMDNKQLSILNQYREKEYNALVKLTYDDINKKIKELKAEKSALEKQFNMAV